MSQFIPTMFLFQALPVFMRQQGVSRQAIGLLSSIPLPIYEGSTPVETG
ncbi:MAG: hypothetical protein V7K55_24920 [Nostoc sp.]